MNSDKYLELTSDIKNIFHGVSLLKFSESSSKFRNQLSHSGHQEINFRVWLQEDYYIAQDFLGVCILISFGINQLNERTAYYSRFEDAADQLYHFQKRRIIPHQP